MRALRHWREVLTAGMRGEGADLTVRQMAILLTIYMDNPPATVRGLAAHLGLAKPAVTRALDRLERLGFARRGPDPSDGRNVLIHRTVAGAMHLYQFAETIGGLERPATTNGERAAASADG